MADVVDVRDVRDTPETPAFETRFGAEMRRLRRERGLRRRHIARDLVPTSTIRAVERGQVRLTRPLVTCLANRYGADLEEWLPRRSPVTISDGHVIIDGRTETIRGTSSTATLQAYLRLVRSLRSPADTPLTALRRDDIDVLAGHLDMPCASVVLRLAELMGARGDETRAMVQLYLDGAKVVGLASAPA